MQYGPWGRNHNRAIEVATTNPAADPPLLQYIPTWIGSMIMRLYFAINYDHTNYIPLLFPIISGSLVGALGIILCFIYIRPIIKTNPGYLLFLVVILVYVASLFYLNFSEYLRYKKAYAINGRYLIIVMPIILAWIGLAYRQLLIKLFKPKAKSVAAILSVIIISASLLGGGALEYLVQSDSSWYIQNQTIVDFNMGLQKIAKPLIPGNLGNKFWP
jgi:hypothetical protein